jgi:hypothetical protein
MFYIEYRFYKADAACRWDVKINQLFLVNLTIPLVYEILFVTISHCSMLPKQYPGSIAGSWIFRIISEYRSYNKVDSMQNWHRVRI